MQGYWRKGCVSWVRKAGRDVVHAEGEDLRSCSFAVLVPCTAGWCGYLKEPLQNKCTDKF